MPTEERKKTVAIIGGGVAGLSCAWSLSQSPEKFEIDLWDSSKRPGGVATSEEVMEGITINDGVQGAPPTYYNLLKIHKALGFTPSEISMKISFGQGELAWNNYETRPVQKKFEQETKRFGEVLRWVYWLTPVFIAIPISTFLWIMGFSEEFGSAMVYPLVALFFGTGNQTPNVPAALIARVFLDPELRIFEYDPRWLLSQTPRFFAFPKLREVYAKYEATIKQADTKTEFHWGTKVLKVRRKGPKVLVVDETNKEHTFDAVVFACSAEEVLKMIHSPTWLEKRVLGNVKYYDDITVTHTDEKYMRDHYHLGDKGEQYFIHNYPKAPEKIEMSFDLTEYQPMLKEAKSTKKAAPRVFQTIFLDKKGSQHMWTREKINRSSILLEKWWRQFAHTWSHFLFTVPLLRFIQGGECGNVLFAGAYTLFNTHELACVSGLAAAERLGAVYPHGDDVNATKTINMYTFVSHGALREGQGGCIARWLVWMWGWAMTIIAMPLLLLQTVLMAAGVL